MVDPAARDDAGVDAIESDDVGCTEERIGHQPEHPCNAVLGEDVHCIVNMKVVFHWNALEWGLDEPAGERTLSSIIARHSCHDAQDYRPPRGAVSRCRRGGNKTRNGA